MSKLDYLEVTENFKSYYQTLCDVHYYLNRDNEWGEAKIQAATQVISKLILGFIKVKGQTFREMGSEQFEKEFQLFQDDFLAVIQSGGLGNIDFEEFSLLIDEILGIAVKRIHALSKIQNDDFVGLSEPEAALTELINIEDQTILEPKELELEVGMIDGINISEVIASVTELEIGVLHPLKDDGTISVDTNTVIEKGKDEQVTASVEGKVVRGHIDRGQIESNDYYRNRTRRKRYN